VPYQISYTPTALGDLAYENARRRGSARLIRTRIEEQLTHLPTVRTRHRHPRREEELSEWQLEVQAWRVFYDVRDREVRILRVGRKEGNRLYLHGEEYTADGDDE